MRKGRGRGGEGTWKVDTHVKGDDNENILRIIINNYSMNVLPGRGFWYFARSRNREFQVNPRNPAKFTKTREITRNSLEILPNTCRHNIFESYLGCWGCLLAVNLPIYLETSSLQRVNNIPKLLGVLRTGKHPGVPSVETGETGDESATACLSCVRSSWRMLRFVKDCASYVHLI